MELELISANGAGKKVSVSDAVFNCDFNEGLVHQVVMAVQASWRSGNSAQKTRAEVSGGGIKPWRQKGTGRARAGTIRSPLWRKGGVIFAAKPRDYGQKVNKKVYKKAICGILSELHRQQRLLVCEDFDCAQPKTKLFKEQLRFFTNEPNETLSEDVLIISQNISPNLYLAARNLPRVHVIDVSGLDPVSLIYYKKILVTADALKALDSQFGGI